MARPEVEGEERVMLAKGNDLHFHGRSGVICGVSLRERSSLNSYRSRFVAAMTSVVVLGFVAMVLTNRYFGERTNRSHAEALADQGLQRMVSQLRVITTDAVNQSAVLEQVVRAQGAVLDPVAALRDVAPLFMASDSIT